MRTVSKRLVDLQNGVINLGFAGENEHTKVRIDCKKAFDQYPTALPSLTVTPPKGDTYPAAVTRDGDIVEWTVTDSDLIYDGKGEIQLAFTQDGKIMKSYIGKTEVMRSNTPTGTIPTPIQNWIDEANDILDEAEEATAAAKAAAEHQPVIDDNGYWNVWDAEQGEYVDTGIKAHGEDGQDGAPGQDGKDGKDGQDGAPGQDGRDGVDATPDLITVDYDDLTFPVAKDTHCYHDGVLYYAKQDIATAEAWTAAHWESTTVESEIGGIKNAIQLLDNDVYTDIWNPITLTLTDGVYYMPTGKPSTYSSAKSSAAVAVTVGDVLKVTAKSQANVPGIIFYNSSTLSTDTFVSYACYTGNTQQYVDEPVTVPTGAKYAIVQGLKANDVILKAPQKAAKFDKYDADIASIQDNDQYMTKLFCNRMMAIGKPSGFSWGSRPKFIMTIRVDDLRTDVDKVAKIIMGEYQFPMMIAACVKELNKTVTGITDPAEKIGDTRLEVCQWVQQHGGEILVHPNETVTSADYNTSVKPLFLDARKVLEDNGIKVRGAAVANATPNATLKSALDPYMYGYFDYSDGYGSIAPYADITTTMIGGWGSDVDQFTGWLNGRIASTSWRTLVIHELGDDVTEQALRDMLDIIATHVQNEDMILANWSTVYDTYGTH